MPQTDALTNTVLVAVCEEYGITIEQLVSKKRRRSKTIVAIAKQVAAYLLKKHTGALHRCIAKDLGYKEHSASLYNMKVFNKVISVDITLKEQVTRIENNINSKQHDTNNE